MDIGLDPNNSVIKRLCAPEPLYNTVHYNMVLDMMAIQDPFSYIIYAFYSRFNTDWIANKDIGLKPNNSVKRLCAPEPLFNTDCYNTVLDITQIRVGPQMAI